MASIIEKASAFLKSKFDEQLKILLKNSSWVFGANILGAVLGFARAVLLARLLGVEHFGIYTIIITFVSTVLELFNLNISTALIKFGAKYKAESKPDKLVALIKGLSVASGVMTFTAVIFTSLLVFLGYDILFDVKNLEIFCIIYAIASGLSLFTTTINLGLLSLNFKFKENAIITIISDILEIIFILAALLIYPNNFFAFFTAVIISKLANALICAFSVWLEFKLGYDDLRGVAINALYDNKKEIRSFVIANSLSASVKTLINKGDVLMLGFAGTHAMVSFYSIAKKLAYSILTISDPLQSSIYPQLSKLVAEQKYEQTKKMLVKITKLFLIPSVGFVTLIYFFRLRIITLIFGIEYSQAAEPFFYLIVVATLIAVFFWNLSMIQSLGLVKFRLMIYIIALITGGITSYYLIKYSGATGAATGLLIAYIIITFSFVAKIVFRLRELQKTVN